SKRDWSSDVCSSDLDVQQHRVAHRELADLLLWLGGERAFVCGLGPGVSALWRGLLAQPLELLRVRPGPLAEPEVLNLVFRRLDDDGAFRVVACASCSSGDLVKLPGLQDAVAFTIELR